MNNKYTESNREATSKSHWDRKEAVSKVVEFEKCKEKQSQRQYSDSHGVARTTLQYWIKQKNDIDAEPALINFFESPEGLAFLHRLITAAHLEFGKHGVASIRNISSFLDLCGLSAFVATSYSTQRRISNKMDSELISFGKEESTRLAEQMPAKMVTFCEDETFHPEVCLVAMDAVSNYIFIEKYVEKRDGATWNKTMQEALANLPVKVVQVAGDEGRGLVNHIKKGLNVHHSSDCFHVPHEIGKGTSGALASEIRHAEKNHETAVKQTQKEERKKVKYEDKPKRPRGRRPDFEKRIEEAKQVEEEAQAALQQARENQEIVLTAKAEIGKVYHPFAPETGACQDKHKIEELLESCFDRINDATSHLSERCRDRVEKAHRVVKNMVATIAFFFLTVDQHMENHGLGKEEKKLMKDILIPGYYLEMAAEKEKDIERKGIIKKKSEELMSLVSQRDGPFSSFLPEKITVLKKIAKECAQIFQRSSSCVEGRNAQLSLRHHGIHRLSDKHLRAQTVIHNFYVKRIDRSTAAARFFEAPHRDVFEHLLDKMDYPARPRKRLAKAA